MDLRDPHHPLHEFTTPLARDFATLFLGRKLGSGAARVVFEHAFDAALVIKIEHGDRSFQNVHEWQLWEVVKRTPKHAEWFAPCRAISPCGRVLVMERTNPALLLPEQMPMYLCDFKPDNFGLLSTSGRFVCHDYGLSMALQRGLTTRMARAKWWQLTASERGA